MAQRQVSGTKTVSAGPAEIFALLADPTKHALFDGSGTVRAAQDGGPDRLELGSKFGMDMKLGASYKILNTVMEFEESRLLAWRHFNGHRWRWELKPLADGRTEVTETFDWSTARIPLLISLSPFPKQNKANIDRTLDRLAEIFAH